MYLDGYGLPCQSDGDLNDQAQRVGMIVVGRRLSGLLSPKLIQALGHIDASSLDMLQVRPGVYARFTGGDPQTVSADQLISILAARLICQQYAKVASMAFQMVLRGGFAQNTKDGIGPSAKEKLPDFMLFRALPLILRMHFIFYPLLLIVDVLLILGALSATLIRFEDDSLIPKRPGPGDVDHNNTIITLLVCNEVLPTPLSKLASWLFKKTMPINYGVTRLLSPNFIQGALDWYHRKDSGGNPEIAVLYDPIVKKRFYA